MADEMCKGSVSYQDWVRLLEVYEISCEKEGQQGAPTYTQQSMMRFAKIIRKTEKQAEDIFQVLAQGREFLDQKTLVAILQKQDPSIEQTELQSIFNHLDFDKQGKINAEYFISEANRHIRALLMGGERKQPKSLPAP